MTEVFDTYSKKTRLYYILQTLSILTILFLIWAWMNNFQVAKVYEPLLIAIVSLGIAVISINIILTGTSLVKMYIKDGELTVSDESIIINSVTIPVNKIKKIVIKSNDYKGAKASDGSGNRIEIYDNTDKINNCRFVINSITQRDNLKIILAHFTENGLIVTSNGF